jgi:membrane-bound lytic murein transglycosylase B
MNFLKIPRAPILWLSIHGLLMILTPISQAQSQTLQDPALNPAAELTLSKEQALDFFLIELSIRENLPLETLREAFRDVKTQTIAKQYMVPSTTGKKRKNWLSYRANVMNTTRLNAGKQFLLEHQAFLKQLEDKSGIPISIVVGILGVETIYGRNMGSFTVRDVLTTFAFDYPPTVNQRSRQSMFKEQLRAHILNCADTQGPAIISAEVLQACLMQEGSFAGAIGMPQFMPSSIRQFAQDGNGDGKIDLRNTPEDAMQSIAQFLLAHGWKKGEPIYLPISSEMQTSPIVKKLADGDPNPKFTLGELKNQKIISSWPNSLKDTSPALIVDLPRIEKDGSEKTDYLVGLKNFEVITQYNRSFFYAMSVTEFGEAVVHNEGITQKVKLGKSQSTNNGRRGHKQ